MSVAPKLTEPGIKYFLNQSLKQCHKVRITHYNNLFNFGLLIGFFIIFGLMLLYKYKGKLTPEEQKQRNYDKYKYILDKVRKTKEDKLKMSQQLITGLPNWNNDFENI